MTIEPPRIKLSDTTAGLHFHSWTVSSEVNCVATLVTAENFHYFFIKKSFSSWIFFVTVRAVILINSMEKKKIKNAQGKKLWLDYKN